MRTAKSRTENTPPDRAARSPELRATPLSAAATSTDRAVRPSGLASALILAALAVMGVQREARAGWTQTVTASNLRGPGPSFGAWVPEGAQLTGEAQRWHTLELTLDGPQASEGGTPNPFLDFRLEVTFQHLATGVQLVVPGFFAADGRAADTGATSGDQWRVRFAPPEVGTWNWTASFRSGSGVALSEDPWAGVPELSIDGKQGSFLVQASDKEWPDMRGRGLLRHVNKHHFTFAGTGEPYLKNGADSPENLLGYYEFDGTWDTGGLATPGLVNGLHRFAPHVQDFDPLDPVDAGHTWAGGKGRGLLGAVNYLGSVGVNSIYFLVFNSAGGDGADTWPWTAQTGKQPSSSDYDRFDVSKLAQWELSFAHMQARGLQLHLVLQEQENDGELDGGALGPQRKLFLRELVARFAHHNALFWNLGEENTNTYAERVAMSGWIRARDAYDHPIGVHSYYNAAGWFYDLLFGEPDFEATSIQGDAQQYNLWATMLRTDSAAKGKPWAIYGDEQGPALASDMSNLRDVRRGWYANLSGGGAGCEVYFGYNGTFGDVQSEDFRVASAWWEQGRRAVDFFRDELPFEHMAPVNNLVKWTVSALGRSGMVYTVFLPDGGTSHLDLESSTESFLVRWFDPRTGTLSAGSVTQVQGPGKVQLGDPPGGPSTEDWVGLVENAFVSRFGTGYPTAAGRIPGLLTAESPAIGMGNWDVEVVDVGPGQPVYLGLSLWTSSVPTPLGTGWASVSPLAASAPWLQGVLADATGRASFSIPVTAQVNWTGVGLFLQAYVPDPAVQGGWALSEGLTGRLH